MLRDPRHGPNVCIRLLHAIQTRTGRDDSRYSKGWGALVHDLLWYVQAPTCDCRPSRFSCNTLIACLHVVFGITGPISFIMARVLRNHTVLDSEGWFYYGSMVSMWWNVGQPIIANRLLLSLRKQHSKDCGMLVSRQATALVFEEFETQEKSGDIESDSGTAEWYGDRCE